jgi:hypothetical protein
MKKIILILLIIPINLLYSSVFEIIYKGEKENKVFNYSPVDNLYKKEELSIKKYDRTYLNLKNNENLEANQKKLKNFFNDKKLKNELNKNSYTIYLDEDNNLYDIHSLNKDLNNLIKKEDIELLAPAMKVKMLLF